MGIRPSLRFVRLHRLAVLLLAAVAIGGCDGGREDAESRAIDWTPASGLGSGPDPGAARVDALKARLVQEPDNEQLLSALGDALFEAHRFEEAIPVYEKAKSLDPFDADVLNDMGLCYFYIGETEKALAAIDGATDADPSYKNAWLSKGFMLMSAGRHEEAVAPLNKVKELDPGGALAKEADRFLERINAEL